MDINFTKENETVKITIQGNIDTEGGSKLDAILSEVTGMDDAQFIIFDMTTVITTTSSGIGKLLRFYKHIDSKGGTMEIHGISDNLYTQFKEIHLDRIFTIAKD